jgi:flagellar motor switch protein FliM
MSPQTDAAVAQAPPAGPPDAEAGDTSPQAPDSGAGRATVTPLDFSRPTKFVPELRRRIARVIGPFAKASALRLSAELKAPVELRQGDSREMPFSNARAELSPDDVLAAIRVAPTGGQMLLAVERAMLLRALDSLLGGSVAAAAPDRRLSDIDLALAEKLLDALISQLSLAWQELGGPELGLAAVDVELDSDSGVQIPMSEPTYALTLECTLAGIDSRMLLLIPWGAISGAVAKMLDHGRQPPAADPHQAIALTNNLGRATVLVRAEIGATHLAVEEVSALAPGSLIRLDTRAEHGVRLLVDRVVLAHGQPGRHGRQKAVKLTTPVEAQIDPSAPAVPAASGTRLRRIGPLAPVRDQEAGLGGLRGVDVRVWAELGRVRLPLRSALALPEGAVLPLDQAADEPIALYANGMPLAHGALLVTEDGEWAVRLGGVVSSANAA